MAFLHRAFFRMGKKKYFRYLANKINADGCHIGQKDFDIKKARKILKWKPKVNIHGLIEEMINYEM